MEKLFGVKAQQESVGFIERLFRSKQINLNPSDGILSISYPEGVRYDVCKFDSVKEALEFSDLGAGGSPRFQVFRKSRGFMYRTDHVYIDLFIYEGCSYELRDYGMKA